MSDVQLDFPALHTTARKHQAEIARLVPLVLELAHARGDGITVADVRDAGTRKGLLPATAKGRDLSWLGALLPAAGLVPTGEWRRSHIPASHGNLQQVFRLPGRAA